MYGTTGRNKGKARKVVEEQHDDEEEEEEEVGYE